MSVSLYSDPDDLIRIIRESSSKLDPIPTGEKPRPPSKAFTHLVFDIYGTLMVSGVGDIGNSAPADRGSALMKVLVDAGAPSPPPAKILEAKFLEAIEDHQESTRAKGVEYPEVEIREVWQSFIEETVKGFFPSPKAIEEIALRFELEVNPVWPMPGLVSTLKSLRDYFPAFGVVSNAQFFTPLLFSALTGESLEDLGFDENLCVWSFEEREAKPSPHLFSLLLERIGADVNEADCLYVGNDMLNDISAASHIGLQTALFAGDQRSLRLRETHPFCEILSPDSVLTTLEQLIPT
ncbi:MAG: HAD family hydrolase [Verrucomicrobiota bacterium]